MSDRFDFTEYLQLARWIADSTQPSPADQCRYRGSIGRAYYAAFNFAREFLLRQGSCDRLTAIDESGEQGPQHNIVINCLINSGRTVEKRHGYRLKEMRLDRNRADYNCAPASAITEATMAKNLKDAEELITALREVETQRPQDRR